MTDILALIVILILLRRITRDDTDQPGWFGSVSGMALYTDHKTGLQYLGNPLGGITPRLDAEGRHMKAESGND
jgi:hypothetical protein